MLNEWTTQLLAGCWLGQMLVAAWRSALPGLWTTVQQHLRQRGLERMMRLAAPGSRFTSFDGPNGWYLDVVVAGPPAVLQPPTVILIMSEQASDPYA